MIDSSAPCKDCPHRRVEDGYNCHSHCEDYARFSESRREENQKIQKERWIYGYYRERTDRIDRRIRRLKSCPQYRNRMK